QRQAVMDEDLGAALGEVDGGAGEIAFSDADEGEQALLVEESAGRIDLEPGMPPALASLGGRGGVGAGRLRGGRPRRIQFLELLEPVLGLQVGRGHSPPRSRGIPYRVRSCRSILSHAELAGGPPSLGWAVELRRTATALASLPSASGGWLG